MAHGFEEQDMEDLGEFALQDRRHDEIRSKTSAILNDCNTFLSNFSDSLRDEESQDALSDIDLDNSSDFGSRDTTGDLILNAPPDPYSNFRANRANDEASKRSPPFRSWGDAPSTAGARRYKRFTALSSLRERKRAMLGACGLALAVILIIATSIPGSKSVSAADGPTPTIDSELSVEAQPVKESFWYLDQDNSGNAKPACRFGNSYPDDSNFELLFGGYLDCCNMFPEACSETIHEVEEWLHENSAPTGEDVNAEAAIAEPTEDHGAIESNSIESVKEEAHQQTGGYWFAGSDAAGRETCLFGRSFPGKLPEHLFDSKDDCCNFFPGFCQIHPMHADAEEPEQLKEPADRWFIGKDAAGKSTCLFGSDYPKGMHMEALFDTKDECCDFSSELCQIKLASLPSTDKVVDDTQPQHPEEATYYWFLGNGIDGKDMCIFSSRYPEEIPAKFLYDTRDECCKAYPASCNVERWIPSEDGSACIKTKITLSTVSDIPGFVFDTKQECDDHQSSAPEPAIESQSGPAYDDKPMLSSISQSTQADTPVSSSEQSVADYNGEATEPSSHPENSLSSENGGHVLPASVSATIDKSAPDSSFLGMSYVGGTRFVSYLRFDLGDLPKNDVVVKAGLILKQSKDLGEDGTVSKTSSAIRLDVNKITPLVEDWILKDVTWNNGDSFIRGRDLIVSQATYYPGENYFGVEVTSAVTAAIEQGDEYIIFEISNKSSPDILSFTTGFGSELSILSETRL